MINLTFVDIKGEIVGITIHSNRIVKIVKNQGGNVMASTIDQVRFNPSTIIIEHPDLKGKPIDFIRKEGLKRLKEKLKSFKTEEEAIDYINADLIGKHGWKGLIKKRTGHRPTRINIEAYLNGKLDNTKDT